MKVPTKHGLDRKFKPWRKGKSSKSNKRSSLKQQLRGQERLLAKILKSSGDDKDNKRVDDEKTKELRCKITALKGEISQKQESILEKKHAEKAHGQRFLDRQRLTRQEKKVRKNANKDQEEELLKIALDQIYVAHHPNDVKYMPLFKHGKRVTDQSRQLYRRAVTRKRILRDINATKKVSWIGTDQYKRLPTTEWTIQDEERVFGGSVSRSTNVNTKSSLGKPEDSRFALGSSHGALLKAAEQAEKDLVENDEEPSEETIIVKKAKTTKECTKNDSSDSSSSSSSSSSSDSSSDSEEEELDPLSFKESKKNSGEDSLLLPLPAGKNIQDKVEDNDSSSDSDSSSSSDSDSDSDENKQPPSLSKKSNNNDENDSISSDSSSSSDRDNSDDEDDKKSIYKENSHTSTTTLPGNVGEEDEEIDDFLVDATDNHDVFNEPAVLVPALSTVRGDKSKGFETQSQRPGEYRKKRIRRY